MNIKYESLTPIVIDQIFSSNKNMSLDRRTFVVCIFNRVIYIFFCYNSQFFIITAHCCWRMLIYFMIVINTIQKRLFNFNYRPFFIIKICSLFCYTTTTRFWYKRRYIYFNILNSSLFSNFILWSCLCSISDNEWKKCIELTSVIKM